MLHDREHLTLPGPNSETESLRCQSAVGSLEAQGAKILRLRGMIEVERQKSNTLQADVLRLKAEKLRLSPNLPRSEEVLAELHALCNKFWQYLEPTQSRRDEVNLSSESEWMRMEENQPELATAGGGGMGTDATTLIEVGPSSFAAANDRLHDNPTRSQAIPELSSVLVLVSNLEERERQISGVMKLPRKWNPKHLRSNTGRISEISGSGALT